MYENTQYPGYDEFKKYRPNLVLCVVFLWAVDDQFCSTKKNQIQNSKSDTDLIIFCEHQMSISGYIFSISY